MRSAARCFGGLCLGTAMGLAVLRMDRHVAHVDFHQIMQDQHPDHAVDIDAGRGLIGQHQRIKRQMPGMFARILAPRAVDKGGGTQH